MADILLTSPPLSSSSSPPSSSSSPPSSNLPTPPSTSSSPPSPPSAPISSQLSIEKPQNIQQTTNHTIQIDSQATTEMTLSSSSSSNVPSSASTSQINTTQQDSTTSNLMTTKTTSTSISDRKQFICGVVEGFYGRPWTTEQRKDLFRKINRWGMDSYVYAPKDDYKHRAYWRELYTVEEGDHLASLIAAAKEQNIIFYYALSPGLDMTYSNPKEINTLKRKLEQVSQFGCEAFALLFDDIESEMTKADKEVFQTFAHAQVTVTNEIYNHLNCSRFLFCPTQYCSTRAVPTVINSEYLATLGSKLSLEIDILWTGPRVISKELTVELIQEVTDVLHRPPVIWDNLHANDYDQKRVFLGPYSGRSPELIPLLRGVLTNPNCEFHANAIAIHTLAHWSKCSEDTKFNHSTSADMKLESENEDGTVVEDVPVYLSKNVYHPRLALRNAIQEWLPEFFISKQSFGPITKPHPAVTMVMPVIPIMPSINTCMSLTTTTNTSTNSAPIKVAEVNTTQLQQLAEVCSVVTGQDQITLPNVVMNSLVSSTKIVTNETILNPTAGVNTLTLPSIPVPVSSIGIPIMNLKGTDYKINNKTVDKTGDDDVDDDELDKKHDEAMPIEEDSDDIEQAAKLLEENIADIDDKCIDEVKSVNGGDDIMTDVNETLTTNCLTVNTMQNPLTSVEPMDCMTSPKHTSKQLMDDVIMAENISTSSTGSMQIETSDTSIQSTEMNFCDPLANNSAITETNSTESKCSLLPNLPLHQDAHHNTNPIELNVSNSTTDTISTTMTTTTIASTTTPATTIATTNSNSKPITTEDISLLCDLFYLPFEHGNRAIQLLNEFNWLKSNAMVLVTSDPPHRKGAQDLESAKPEIQEWFQRSERFFQLSQTVILLAKKLANCPNRELCYELFSYVWDIAGVITLLTGYIKWLALGYYPASINTYTQGSYTWFSKGWRETFTSGDQEPWVFRGGLTADLQRLIPVDSGNDLFLYKLPDVPSTSFPIIRPYQYTDEEQVFLICHKTCQDGGNCTDLFPPNLQTISGDRLIGPFVTINPELCLVVEDDNDDDDSNSSSESHNLIGYACAALDAKLFYRNQEMCWLPAMCQKYPISLIESATAGGGGGGEPLAPLAIDSINHFHNFKNDCPVEVLTTHPSVMTCCVLKQNFIDDQSMAKRLVTVLLAALRSNGSSGVHACINNTDHYLHQFYSKLGFAEMYQEPNGKIYMGRNF